MDLSLFHYGTHANDPRNWKMKDKLNGWTSLRACRYLEWSGWYNQDLLQRLLGHYRLFQCFKKDDSRIESRMPLVMSYILHYRAGHGVKYFLSRATSFIYSIGTRGETYPAVEIEGFNKMLINEGAAILSKFLTDADEDFGQALRTAIKELTDPQFFQKANNNSSKVLSPSFWVHVQNDYKHFNDHSRHYNQFNELNEQNEFNEFTEYNQFNQHNELNQLNVQQVKNDFNSFETVNNTTNHSFTGHNHQTIVKEGAKGKEKGVFSKKQMLLFFDFLSESSKFERIDLSKPTRFDGIAELLHAITGKAKDSILEELNDHRKKGLYEYNSAGEKNQLISTLTNLSETCRKGGFRSIANLADKKVKELETTIKDGPAN